MNRKVINIIIVLWWGLAFTSCSPIRPIAAVSPTATLPDAALSATEERNNAPAVPQPSLTSSPPAALNNTRVPPPGTLHVAASVETDPVISSGDAADDPAIWVHPGDPAKSTIIGTDKKAGLVVYDLSGKTLQYLKDGPMDNVDLRYNFPLGGQRIDLVTAGNRGNDTIAIYKVDPATGLLENAAARKIKTELSVYGSCMYYSLKTGKTYIFIDSEKKGRVQQWELFDDGSGKVDAKLARSFEVGSISEGCVADDELGYFYISEENVGIWRYGAEPEAGSQRKMVAPVVPDGKLTPDIEGLAIYFAPGGKGYLIASSQGSSEFVLYDRAGNNDYLLTFDIQRADSIDKVSSTDGIDVANLNFGPLFPQGFFVVQDGDNDPEAQNFKLVPWQSIARLVEPALILDTTWDPRSVKASQ